ncbi:MAG: winged helix-turn-helix transcriptional regulator [Dehalococcoidia bacterium]
MAAVDAAVGLNVLVVSEGPGRSEATLDGLEKLGWRAWRLSPADLLRGEATSRPPDAALVAITGALGPVVQAVQTLVAETPALPIIVLTDDLGAAEQALFGGASAILPLMARTSLVHAQLRAVLRRGAALKNPSEPSGIIRVRALKVDTLRCEVVANSHKLEVTPTEYRILSTLVRYAGRALGADFLLQQSSGVDIGPSGAREIVKVHIARLRKKLEEATGEPDYIINVRNVGYLLDRRRRGGRTD